MISTYGASREQAERFVTLYRAKAPIRAAAHEAGISIIQATMIAQASGILRLTEGFIVNSRGAEIGALEKACLPATCPKPSTPTYRCNSTIPPTTSSSTARKST
ncbi:hypothetical protein [Kingella potus]|uniref:hypothetical protein n=1 Tax=Kingella potus TaxID=265175 RepID=UPI001FD1F411|nr:hypothetical protein [Kingella potus]UOP02051.1 hypothetical protein LVJ84_14465 [Kingella potus]